MHPIPFKTLIFEPWRWALSCWALILAAVFLPLAYESQAPSSVLRSVAIFTIAFLATLTVVATAARRAASGGFDRGGWDACLKGSAWAFVGRIALVNLLPFVLMLGVLALAYLGGWADLAAGERSEVFPGQVQTAALAVMFYGFIVSLRLMPWAGAPLCARGLSLAGGWQASGGHSWRLLAGFAALIGLSVVAGAVGGVAKHVLAALIPEAFGLDAATADMLATGGPLSAQLLVAAASAAFVGVVAREASA